MPTVCEQTWTPERLTLGDRVLRRMAYRRWPTDAGGLRDDLVQAAWLRLLRERFDPSRGVPFQAWLSQRARWAMTDAQRCEGWVRQFRGDRDEPQEICALDAKAPSGDPISELLAIPTPKYSDPFLAQRIREAYCDLPPRLRAVILARASGVGQKALMEPLGVSESRISQLALKAVRLFREGLKKRGVMN